MARRLSRRMRRHLQSEVSPLVQVTLITIYQENIVEPIRVCSDATVRLDANKYEVLYGIISRGIPYYYAGFDVSMANDEDGSAPSIRLSMPNASKKIIEGIETMGAGPLSVDIRSVFADTPDIYEIELLDMELSEVTYDESAISGVISRDLLFNEPHPFRTFTKHEFPSLYSDRGVG